jgi:hypothetical protein
MTWVTDLSHFIDAETGDLPRNVPGPARRLMEHLTKIVAAATTAAANQDHARDQIKCRRRPRHRACPGIMITTSGPMNGSVGGARAAAITESSRTGNRPPGTADQCGPFTDGG